MVFDRSKFKSTSIKTLKKQESDVQELVPTTKGNKDRADFLKIEEGSNKFRIYPAHPDSDSFAFAKCVSWLPQEIEERDEKNPAKVKVKIARMPIFNSKIHGGTKEDIIEEYIKFAKNVLESEKLSDDVLKEKLELINHWKTGILPKTSWVMYAEKIKADGTKTFGQLDISNALKEKLNEIAMVEDADQPIETDPFTDVEDGKAVIITYTSAAKPQDKYKCAIEFRGNYELTDAQLEKFLTYDSLKKRLEMSYTKKDFDKAINGLKLFDDEHEFGVFSYEEWIDKCEEMAKLYPEIEEEEKEAKKTLDSMNREELKAYNKANKLGIVVTNKMSDDDIRGFITEAELSSVEEVEEEVEEEEVEEKEEEQEEENVLPWDKKTDPKSKSTGTAPKKGSAQDKMAEMKKRIGKK